MAQSKDIKRIIKQAKKDGWRLQRQGKHEVYIHEITRKTVTVSTTSNNINTWKRIQGDFRRNSR
jgi:predicted RNA binding protein YcfA (HicA-like mRNA interferase family)